jgi:hypothetical protein
MEPPEIVVREAIDARDILFKALHKKFFDRVFHDDTQELNLLLARKYGFWLIHESETKYTCIKERIVKEKQKIDAIIKQLATEDQQKIQAIVEVYQWKHNTYRAN